MPYISNAKINYNFISPSFQYTQLQYFCPQILQQRAGYSTSLYINSRSIGYPGYGISYSIPELATAPRAAQAPGFGSPPHRFLFRVPPPPRSGFFSSQLAIPSPSQPRPRYIFRRRSSHRRGLAPPNPS